MKKFISSVLIVILLFNFISCNYMTAFAEGSEDGREKNSMEDSMTGEEAGPSDSIAGDVLEDGQVSRVKGSTEKTTTTVGSAGLSALGVVTGVLALLLDISIAFPVELLLAQLSYTTEYDINGDSDLNYFLSLERMVFNRVPLFDINYFNMKTNSSKTYTVGLKGSDSLIEIEKSDEINNMKENVAFMYQAMRILALAIGMLVLIYIGIRMAISTTATEKADYKRMFVSWVESVVLLFVMVYIMVVIMTIGNALTNMFYTMEQAMLGGSKCFEDTIRDTIFTKIFKISGMELTIWSIMYWCLIFIEIKFFWLYLKRVLMVGFLIVISPIITITYAIDKVGDGKAQAFFIWFKEFTVNVLIQPLHALIYMVFILTANEIATKAPLLALAFLLSMGTVEKMVKIIFNLRGLVTLRGVDKFLKKG